MNHLNKLPFIVTAISTMMVGMVSYTGGNTTKTIYLRMMIAIICFYILGKLLERTILTLYFEMKVKEAEEKRKQKEVEMKKKREEIEAKKAQKQKGVKLDLSAGETMQPNYSASDTNK